MVLSPDNARHSSCSRVSRNDPLQATLSSPEPLSNRTLRCVHHTTSVTTPSSPLRGRHLRPDESRILTPYMSHSTSIPLLTHQPFCSIRLYPSLLPFYSVCRFTAMVLRSLLVSLVFLHTICCMQLFLELDIAWWWCRLFTGNGHLDSLNMLKRGVLYAVGRRMSLGRKFLCIRLEILSLSLSLIYSPLNGLRVSSRPEPLFAFSCTAIYRMVPVVKEEFGWWINSFM